MRFCSVVFIFWLGLLGGVPPVVAAPTDKITAETSSTSIYIGRVTLLLTPLARDANGYAGNYKAKVFPYFFMGEHGQFRIDCTDDDLARLARGETVEFKGHAETNDREERRITGRAVPADATSGKIKVRVWVTEKIQLIFNTTYRFGG